MKILTTLIITLVIATVQSAAAEPVQRLTLKDAINMALDNNHYVKSAGLNAQSLRYSVPIAASRYYPNISFEETFAASNAPTQSFMMKLDQGRFAQDDFQINNLNHPGTWQNFKTALTVRQPLFDPSISPAKELAEKDSDRYRLAFEATKQDVAFQVFTMFLEIKKSASHLIAAEQAIKEASENLRVASARKADGLGLLSDELRARTHQADMEQKLITARNNLMLAKMRLAIVIGAKEGTSVNISDDNVQFKIAGSAEDLSRTAMEERKDLQQHHADIGKGDARVKMARNAYLPALDAFGSYQMNSKQTPFGTDNDAWIAGVSLRWLLFDGFRREHEHSQAVLSRAAASEALSGKTREIRFQISESILRHEEASKRLEVARNAVKAAQESVRLINKRFENSLATMFELLDAQSALNQARSRLTDSEADYELSGGRIYYSAGVFVKEITK